MASRKRCVRKDELAEDADWLAFSLEIFSRAFQLLKDFSEIFKSRIGKCCRIDHDKMQLFGALNVVLVITKSKRPGLFRDICGCARQEQHEDISGCIIGEINKVFTNLQKCCVIENVVREVKDVLGIIKSSPTFSMSVQLKMLSYLLQEIMKKLISCRETSADQLTRAQSKWILRLVNNFIRDWSIENSRCRFCDHATNKVARRWGAYCCEILQLYYDVWEEWALQQSISNAYKQEPSDIRSSSARACPRGFSKPKDVRAVDDGSNVKGRWTTGIPQDVFDIDRTVKHRDPDSGRIVTCRRVVGSPLRKTEAESYRAAASRLGDKFDGIRDSDLRMAACRWIDGELGKGARSRCNIDKDPGSPIAADRREERDDVPHGLNAVAPGDPDTDEEGTAVRKMRKIKSDMTPAPDRKRDRPLRSDTEGNGTDRSPREMAGNRSRSRDSRLREPEEYHPDAESPKGKKGARGAPKSKGERMSPDRSRTMKSRGEADRWERDEEPLSGKKKSKRSQNVESIREQPGRSKVKKLGRRDEEEYDDDDDRSDAKTPRGKKKPKGRQDVESIREQPGRSKVKKLGRRDEEEYDEDDDRSDAKTPRGKKKPKGRQDVESIREQPGRSKVKKLGRRDEEEYDDDDDRSDAKTPRGKKKSKRSQNLEAIDEEHKGNIRSKQLSGRGREIEDTDDEEKAGRSGGRKMKKRKNEVEDKEDVGESARERRKKKTDALDRREAGRGSHFDEEESVPKRDGKRRDRWTDDEADSDVTKRGGKIRGASARDKSTPNSEGQSKKETSEASAKGRRGYDSSKADDDYSKINGPRSRQRTTKAPDLPETERRRLIEYQLSNQSFVKLGWTMMPIPKTMKKVIYYQAKPAKPHLNCPGGKDCVGVERKSQIVGVFDTVGNGAVFDEDAATRLSYNQIGGIWGDNPAGLPLMWKWDVDEKNLSVETVYQEKSTTSIEKFLHRSLKSTGSGKAPSSSSSPVSSRNKEKKVVEQKPVVTEHDSEEEVTSGLPDKHSKDNHVLKMICMKLTDNISLRIANRREICLQFFAPRRNIRIELGTVLNFNKEVASYFVDTSLNNALLKCKFDGLLKSPVEPEDSLCGLVERLREVRKSARQRKFMIRKYKPYLPLRKA
ncbi:uncharacterized protein LOC143221931 [Lasioglossum baleicum]|uniref:uncharacterized protein LOC143221931 n=1 Tax=Lasioglossum baleicum TaxID=434251 RepID=UPI003FCEC283